MAFFWWVFLKVGDHPKVENRADVFILAAEPSGDHLGADLARALEKKMPSIKLLAIGGPAMGAAGLQSQMDINGLAILGFVEGLKAYPFVLRKVREATEIILKTNPKSVVLIDSWGFMVRVAKALKAAGYTGQVIKFVAPQVWAMRSGRAKVLARYIDHLLSTQPMDEPYFREAGLPQTFVGNPVLDQDYGSGNAEDFRRRHALNPNRPVIGFFFGSRPSEIDRVGPAILHALDRLKLIHPNYQPVCVIADPVRVSVDSMLGDRELTRVDQSEFLGAIATMDGALACSGTVTTQLAAAGVPTVVIYRLSSLTYWVAMRMFKPRFISLVNISADANNDDLDDPLMPEFVQEEIMTDAPVDALTQILDDPEAAAYLKGQLIRETRRMGAGSDNASDRAAAAILSMID
ncbi:MAG: lipid-A-disaccharide synthase [Litorimonas sp.]